jgi:hypothetical protein
MNYQDRVRGPGGPIKRARDSAGADAFDFRFLGLLIGRVTENKDPEKQNRIKVRLQFQQEDDSAEMQTGWLSQITNFAGPTDLKRGRVFGVDWPLPEVGSLVCVFFNGGNIYDGYYWGQPRYQEGNHGAPELEKDDHKDWSFRLDLQNGLSLGVDTEGNAELVVPGHLRVKLQSDAFVSARGEYTLSSTNIQLDAKAVLRLLGVTIDHSPYPRPDQKVEIRQRTIDMYEGPPGRKDPGIGKVPDLE